jgi:hypothetical protein
MDSRLKLYLVIEIGIKSQPQLLVLIFVLLLDFPALAVLTLVAHQAARSLMWLGDSYTGGVADEVLGTVGDAVDNLADLVDGAKGQTTGVIVLLLGLSLGLRLGTPLFSVAVSVAVSSATLLGNVASVGAVSIAGRLSSTVGEAAAATGLSSCLLLHLWLR